MAVDGYSLPGWTFRPDPQARLDRRGQELMAQIKRLHKVDGRILDPGKQIAVMLPGFSGNNDQANYLYHGFGRGVYAKREQAPDEPEDELIAIITMRGNLPDMTRQHQTSLAPCRGFDLQVMREEVKDERARFAGNWWQT